MHLNVNDQYGKHFKNNFAVTFFFYFEIIYLHAKLCL